MHLCYVDESGTPETSGNTSHYVLAGLSIPIERWRECDAEIEILKRKYGLDGQEIHVAWLMRSYLEQSRIPDFALLDYALRRAQVASLRLQEILRLQRAQKPALLKQTKKNYRETERYMHLSYDERRGFVREVAQSVFGWGFARLFAECIDKVHFDPVRSGKTVGEQSLEQLVSRFETFLKNVSKGRVGPEYGLLIHDNNETVARKHTALMKGYHQSGTLWTAVQHIIETPLFVDSELTSMVQVADLCAYALRRYFENGEEELLDLVLRRADTKDGVVVGVRHFTKRNCLCKVCIAHRRSGPA